jgi:hypothetical protein
MKFLLKEEEKNEILNMYGIIKEQTACNWENYQNGDGMSKPKINISKSESGVSASYQGPETGFCIQHAQGSTKDSLHQLAGVVRKVVSDYLKELYNSQNYVYPVLENISMTKKNNFFSINVPFAKTTEDKAITNFNERGGWGHDGSNTLQQFLSSISDETKYALINVIKKVASGGNSPDITENWVSFRDIQKFPIKSLNDKNEKKTNGPITTTKIQTNTLSTSKMIYNYQQSKWDFVPNQDMISYQTTWTFNINDDNTGMISNGEVNYDILSHSKVENLAYLKVYNTKVQRNMDIIVKKINTELGVVVFDKEQRISYYFNP